MFKFKKFFLCLVLAILLLSSAVFATDNTVLPTALHALPLYATAFESMNALDKLENFASVFGANFYGLPVNTSTITLIKQAQTVPDSYPYLDGKTLTPLLAGQTLAWQVL